MVRKVKLRKREIAFALIVGALGAFAATGILTDGFGGPGSMLEKHQKAYEEKARSTGD